MFGHHDHLQRLAHEQQELLAHLTTALVARNYEMASIDLTKLNANSAEIQRIGAAAAAGGSPAIRAAHAAQLENHQGPLDAATAQQAPDIAPLSAQFPPPVATPLAVSPSSITGTVGATLSQTLAVSGGTAPCP